MKEDVLPIERRCYSRSRISLDCTLTVNGGEPVRGRTCDIAQNGISITTRCKAHQGDEVEIAFDGHGHCKGRVSRVFEGGLAVELPASSLAMLAMAAD